MRTTLLVLLALVAVNALAGGYYALAGAEGVPREWLAGSPFTTYVVPGWILLAGVGGSSALALVAALRRWPAASSWALGAALVLAVWIAVQVAIIGFVSWLQPAMFLVAVAIGALAARNSRRGRLHGRVNDGRAFAATGARRRG